MLIATAIGMTCTPAYAEEASPQQAAMLTEKIADGLTGLIDQVEDPATQSDAVHEKSAIVAISELKQLAKDVTKLNSMLSGGKSLMQTRPLYQKIADRGSNIDFFAAGIEIRDSIRDQAKATAGLMDQLDTLYE